jgi:ABC-type transport system involved in cytochrome bd biosynthesis fused ATPase/permease subunit
MSTFRQEFMKQNKDSLARTLAHYTTLLIDIVDGVEEWQTSDDIEEQMKYTLEQTNDPEFIDLMCLLVDTYREDDPCGYRN